MELSVDTLNLAANQLADCEESLEEWNEAYRRVESYLLALHVDNKLLLSSLVLKILGRASDRLEKEPNRAPVELAAEETDQLLVEWFRDVLGEDEEEEPVDRLSARGRLALMLVNSKTRWQQIFLNGAPVPKDMRKQLRDAYLQANPEFSFANMHPRPIDLGIVDHANRTIESMGQLSTLIHWLLWSGFGLIIAAIFYFTR
ncbi:hypothetical protein NT6N_11300 [Oceaniferula spumae]|uniref:Uncharacterized protein n=1 Tax=Oceaniferula spumae TaxID=2979115 RepID=A0AAT9FJH8_9BACT